MTQMEIKVKRNGDTPLPKQATDQAAGYDIIATSDPKIVGEKLDSKFFLPDEPKVEWWKHVFYIEYETGLFIAPTDKNIHTLIYPRSSISSKTNMVLANSIGLVDYDYRGQILCRFRYIWQPFDLAWLSIKDHSNPDNPYLPMTLGNINPDRIYKKGDTIAQLVFSPTINVNFQFVDELDQTARGEGGHGSTDQTKVFSLHQGDGAKTLSDLYSEAGGVPIKKRYSDEMKERERIEGAPKKGTFMPPAGIHERTSK